jgi:hypothetical protein
MVAAIKYTPESKAASVIWLYQRKRTTKKRITIPEVIECFSKGRASFRSAKWDFEEYDRESLNKVALI